MELTRENKQGVDQDVLTQALSVFEKIIRDDHVDNPFPNYMRTLAEECSSIYSFDEGTISLAVNSLGLA